MDGPTLRPQVVVDSNQCATALKSWLWWSDRGVICIFRKSLFVGFIKPRYTLSNNNLTSSQPPRSKTKIKNPHCPITSLLAAVFDAKSCGWKHSFFFPAEWLALDKSVIFTIAIRTALLSCRVILLHGKAVSRVPVKMPHLVNQPCYKTQSVDAEIETTILSDRTNYLTLPIHSSPSLPRWPTTRCSFPQHGQK